MKRAAFFGTAAFNRAFARGWLLFGFAFLYVPIVALVVYSFNHSPVANRRIRLRSSPRDVR